jgi:hypothetical protein
MFMGIGARGSLSVALTKVGRPRLLRIHLYALCWNDADMLPFFFRHYDRFITRYFIFDEGSTDTSISILRNRANVVLRRFVRRDPASFVNSEQALSNECWKDSRGVADWVIVTDIDEHLYHYDLATLLIRYKADGTTFVPALGYQIISEDFPDPTEMLCESRTQGVPFQAMCKANLFDPTAIEEINYGPGRHAATPIGDVRLPSQAELLLLHYKYLGFERTLARHRQLRTGLGPKDIENGWGQQYSWSETQLRDSWNAVAEKAVDVHKHACSPDLDYSLPPWWDRVRSRTQLTPL